MKQFLAFYGDVYYPSGGMGDYLGDFDTKAEAINSLMDEARKDAPDANSKKDLWRYQWAHVYDTHLRARVWEPPIG